MPFALRPVSLVTDSRVDDNAARNVTLPDGPGYYRILRLCQIRTAGAAAGNHQPQINDGGATITAQSRAYQAPAAVALANPVLYPSAPATSDPEPGRYVYAPAGVIQWSTGATVLGETFGLSLMVELVR